MINYSLIINREKKRKNKNDNISAKLKIKQKINEMVEIRFINNGTKIFI